MVNAICDDVVSEIRNIINEKKTDEVLKKRQQQLQKALEEKAKEVEEANK